MQLLHQFSGRQRRDQAAQGQGDAGTHFAIHNAGKAATHLLQRIGRHEDIAIAHTGDNQVVGIMGNAGGNRSFAQAKTLHESQANAATGMMAFDDYEFEQITCGIGDNRAVFKRSFFPQVRGGDLPRLDTDNFHHS